MKVKTEWCISHIDLLVYLYFSERNYQVCSSATAKVQIVAADLVHCGTASSSILKYIGPKVGMSYENIKYENIKHYRKW